MFNKPAATTHSILLFKYTSNRWVAFLLTAWVALAADDAHAQKRGIEPATSQPAIVTKIEELRIRHRTEHYAIAGTIEQKKLEEYGRALEYIHKEYVKGFDKLLKEEKKAAAGTKGGAKPVAKKPGTSKSKPKPKPGKSAGDKSDDPAEKDSEELEDKEGDKDRFRVIVFANDKEYKEFGKQYLSGSNEHSIGCFVPYLKSLLISNQKDTEMTYQILFHEAFHQFVDRHIANPPMWLNEGLATYYGVAKPTARGLDWSRPPRNYWDLCRQAIQFDAVIPVAEVLRANHTEFYDMAPVKLPGMGDRLSRRDLFYGEAYTLVHVLMQDRGGLTKLQNYIRDLAQDDGSHVKQITNKYFDERACLQLQQAWSKYVKNRNDRPVVRRP